MKRLKGIDTLSFFVVLMSGLFALHMQAGEIVREEPEKIVKEDESEQASNTETQQQAQVIAREQQNLAGEGADVPSLKPDEKSPGETIDIGKEESSPIYQATSKGIEVVSLAAQAVQEAWNVAIEQLRKIAEFLRTTFIAIEKRLPVEARTRFNALADSQLSFREDGEKLQELAPTLTRASVQLKFVTDIEASRPEPGTEAYKAFMRGWELYARTFDNFATSVDAANTDELEAFDAARSALIETLNVLNKLNIPMRKAGAVNSYPITDALFRGITFEEALKKVQDLKPGEKLFK